MSLQQDTWLSISPTKQARQNISTALHSHRLQLHILCCWNRQSNISEHFFQLADFISGNEDLSLTDSCNMHAGFLALNSVNRNSIFQENLATVVSRTELETPRQLHNSIAPACSTEEKCKQWYLRIRAVAPVMTEDQRPPTLSALWRHWQRSCWVQRM